MTTILALMMLVGQGSQTQWHEVYSLSCVQFKVSGKGKGSVPFALYRAVDRGSQCCNVGALVYRGKTERFGYFTVPVMLDKKANYYLVFDHKGKELKIGIEMRNNYQDKRCAERDHIIDFDRFDHPEVTVMVTVD